MLDFILIPSSNFDRYVSQTKQFINEANDPQEWTQQTPPLSTVIQPNVSPSIPIPSPTITENVEPFPYAQHAPGPIQRPIKLLSPSAQRPMPMSSLFVPRPIQSPGTPDVIDQLNQILDHQNNQSSNVVTTPNLNHSSVSTNDLAASGIPWTPFSSTEWPSKYNASWSLTSIQSPTESLTTQIQNPFALMSTMNEQQQTHPNREETSVWSSALGTATPRSISSVANTERTTAWSEMFPTNLPSSVESTKPTNSSWMKFWPASDPSSPDCSSSTRNEREAINPFWNLNTLSNEPIVTTPTLTRQQSPSPVWWINSTSNPNNNPNQVNNLTGDTTNTRDQSRWDFAR